MKTHNLAALLILCLLYLTGCSVSGSDDGDDDNGEEQTESFDLDLSVSPLGAGSVSPRARSFDGGDLVTVEATSSDGYTFLEWTGDQQSTDNPYTFTIEENTEMTANFEASSSRYTTTLLVADPTDTLRYLAFGQREDASDAIDGQDVEVPPAPPQGLHAYFQNETDLAKDYRSPDAASHTWTLQLQAGEQDSLFFKWQINEQFMNGSLTMRNEDSSIEVDMLGNREVAIHQNQAAYLLIEYQLDN